MSDGGREQAVNPYLEEDVPEVSGEALADSHVDARVARRIGNLRQPLGELATINIAALLVDEGIERLSAFDVGLDIDSEGVQSTGRLGLRGHDLALQGVMDAPHSLKIIDVYVRGVR